MLFWKNTGGTIIYHGTTKRSAYKCQQAANTIFWPALIFLKSLQKLLCSLTCTSILKSNYLKVAVNEITKGLLTK